MCAQKKRSGAKQQTQVHKHQTANSKQQTGNGNGKRHRVKNKYFSIGVVRFTALHFYSLSANITNDKYVGVRFVCANLCVCARKCVLGQRLARIASNCSCYSRCALPAANRKLCCPIKRRRRLRRCQLRCRPWRREAHKKNKSKIGDTYRKMLWRACHGGRRGLFFWSKPIFAMLFKCICINRDIFKNNGLVMCSTKNVDKRRHFELSAAKNGTFYR